MRQVVPLEARQKRGGGRMAALVVGGVALGALALAGRGTGAGAPASPGGSIGSVSLSRRGRRARFGQLTKAPGDSLRIDYSLNFGTRDAAGNPISWPYRWDVIATILGGQELARLSRSGNFGNRTINNSSSVTLANPAASGDDIVVSVELLAADSDPQGNPLSTFSHVAVAQAQELVHLNGGTGGSGGGGTNLEQRRIDALCQLMASLGSNPQVFVPPMMSQSEAQGVLKLNTSIDHDAELLRRLNPDPALVQESINLQLSRVGSASLIAGIASALVAARHNMTVAELDQAVRTNQALFDEFRSELNRVNSVSQSIQNDADLARSQLISLANKFGLDLLGGSLDVRPPARVVVRAQDVSTLSRMQTLVALGPPQGVSTGLHNKANLQAQLGC